MPRFIVQFYFFRTFRKLAVLNSTNSIGIRGICGICGICGNYVILQVIPGAGWWAPGMNRHGRRKIIVGIFLLCGRLRFHNRHSDWYFRAKPRDFRKLPGILVMTKGRTRTNRAQRRKGEPPWSSAASFSHSVGPVGAEEIRDRRAERHGLKGVDSSDPGQCAIGHLRTTKGGIAHPRMATPGPRAGANPHAE